MFSWSLPTRRRASRSRLRAVPPWWSVSGGRASRVGGEDCWLGKAAAVGNPWGLPTTATAGIAAPSWAVASSLAQEGADTSRTPPPYIPPPSGSSPVAPSPAEGGNLGYLPDVLGLRFAQAAVLEHRPVAEHSYKPRTMFAAARVLIFAVVIGALTVAKPLYQTRGTEHECLAHGATCPSNGDFPALAQRARSGLEGSALRDSSPGNPGVCSLCPWVAAL